MYPAPCGLDVRADVKLTQRAVDSLGILAEQSPEPPIGDEIDDGMQVDSFPLTMDVRVDPWPVHPRETEPGLGNQPPVLVDLDIRLPRYCACATELPVGTSTADNGHATIPIIHPA